MAGGGGKRFLFPLPCAESNCAPPGDEPMDGGTSGPAGEFTALARGGGGGVGTLDAYAPVAIGDSCPAIMDALELAVATSPPGIGGKLTAALFDFALRVHVSSPRFGASPVIGIGIGGWRLSWNPALLDFA